MNLLHFAVASVVLVLAQSNPDEVTVLPGWKGALPSKHYSGYLNIPGGKHHHYWHVESEGNPSLDPLVFWFNGGPGCSSMGGFFTEQGPFLVNDDLTLTTNEGRWNTFANMVFTESPAGAGYAYADTPAGYNHNDTSAAIDNLNAILQFLTKFPAYKNRDIYLAGESYAGIYVPTLAQQIVRSHSSDINLKGILVGNGCIGSDVGACSGNEGGQIDINFMKDRALISVKAYNAVVQACGSDWTSDTCQTAVNDATDQTGPIDVYNIYYPCASNLDANSSHILRDPAHPNFPWFAPPSIVDKAVALKQGPQACFVDNDPVTKYLNKAVVKAAIHISPNAKGEWRVCGPRVGGGYDFNYDSTEKDETKDVYPELIRNSLRVMIFNGDVDLCVPYNGNAHWTSVFGEVLGVVEEWRPWLVDKQVAGYVTTYKSNFTFATVKGAGHMVPEFQPAAGKALAQRFIANTPL